MDTESCQQVLAFTTYEKDAFSTINQSTGSYCFDKWVAYYRMRRPNIVGQFHDESINVIRGEQNDTQVF